MTATKHQYLTVSLTYAELVRFRPLGDLMFTRREITFGLLILLLAVAAGLLATYDHQQEPELQLEELKVPVMIRHRLVLR